LIPRDVKFLDLFVECGNNLAAAAAQLRDLVEKFDRVDERISEIQALEKKGDEIDREINRRLEAAFIAPFDREDIHELTVRMDDVVDLVQAVGESMLIYDVKSPTEDSIRLAQILAEQGS
jgi:predicted phosphate transport protein (TIGR00153 family)